MHQRFSFFTLLLCGCMIVATALWYPKWEKPQTEATLSWDVLGYYFYLPALFIYKDVKKLTFKDSVIEKYRPTGSFYQAFLHNNGNYVMKYPIGMAALYSPFFGIAHVAAGILGYPQDGFSLPYQMAISWGSILIAFLGLWMMRKVLCLYFSEVAVGISLILLVFATNYLNYTAIDGGMPHNWIFTLVAILIWQTIQWYKKPSFLNSFLIAICIGLAALSRPTDILIAWIPVFWGIKNKADFQHRVQFWITNANYLVLIIGLVAAIGSLQLEYWKYVSGDLLVYSYQDQGFSWLRPHIINVLISYRKGWLVYTPIMLLALIGFVVLYRQYRFLFWGISVYFISHFYVTAAWDIWWYGGAFGQRALIQAYPILLFPLAALIERYGANFSTDLSGRIVFIGIIVFACFCSWLNIFQTYQAHSVGFEVDAMTKAYYWRIFGNTNPTILDKKLLDTKEDFLGKRKEVALIYETDFETDTKHPIVKKGYTNKQALSGEYALISDAINVFSPTINIPFSPTAHTWVRISAQFYAPQKEWEIWRMTQMIVQFKKGEKVIKKGMIRIQRQIGEKNWQPNWIDMKIPDEAIDTLSIVFWNAGSEKILYIDDLKVEMYLEER